MIWCLLSTCSYGNILSSLDLGSPSTYSCKYYFVDASAKMMKQMRFQLLQGYQPNHGIHFVSILSASNMKNGSLKIELYRMLQTLNKTQRIKEWESWKKWGKRENSSLWEEDRLWGILPISIRRQLMMLSWTRILMPLTVNMEGDRVLEIPFLKNNSVGKTILEWTSWSLSDLRKKFAAPSASST